MNVSLLHHTPLWVASTAIRKCWASEDKSDTNTNQFYSQMNMTVEDMSSAIESLTGPKDKELIERVGNKNKHSSTLEHLNYSFDIDGISRACLQELARHRHASMSVKSSRYTLKELRDAPRDGSLDFRKFVVLTHNNRTNTAIMRDLEFLKDTLEEGVSNDIAKYCLPEAYKTSLVWTVNARSLQNFLSLRTDKSALWEIQELAHNIYNKLPDEHKYLFSDFVKEY